MKDEKQTQTQSDEVAQDDSLLVEDQADESFGDDSPETENQPNPLVSDESSQHDPVKEASESMNEEDTESPAEQTKPTAPPKKSKKGLVLLLIILLLVAGGGGWYYYQNIQETTETSTAPTTETEPAAPTYQANTVAYAYRESDSVPYDVFYRPAAGGDREEVQKLNRNQTITNSDVSGDSVAFAADDSVFVSTDSGATYTEIIDLTGGEKVTSLAFNVAGDKIAVGVNSNSTATLKSYDLTGENPEDIYDTKKAGIYVEGWNDDTIVMSEGCFECDGFPTPFVYDREEDALTEITYEAAEDQLITMEASNDLSTIILTAAPANSDGLGRMVPYTVLSYDVASDESTEIQTIGESDETNENGTAKTYDVMIGFFAGTNTPYYAVENELYKVEDDNAVLFYESDNTIFNVQYASDDTVIASTGKQQADYNLVNYSVADEETTTILSGDNNTVLLGVTTN